MRRSVTPASKNGERVDLRSSPNWQCRILQRCTEKENLPPPHYPLVTFTDVVTLCHADAHVHTSSFTHPLCITTCWLSAPCFRGENRGVGFTFRFWGCGPGLSGRCHYYLYFTFKRWPEEFHRTEIKAPRSTQTIWKLGTGRVACCL